MTYARLLKEAGGILDDLMVTRVDDGLMLLVHAACKDADLAHLRATLDRAVAIEPHFDRALLALQGPAAAAVLARFGGAVATMPFMSAAHLPLGGIAAFVTRSGYTREDRFQISHPAQGGPALADTRFR